MARLLSSMISLLLLGCGPNSTNQRTLVPIEQEPSEDAKSKVLVDCNGKSFSSTSGSSRIPAEDLYLEHYSGQPESLCSLALNSSESTVVLHFSSNDCQECEQNSRVISEIVAEQGLRDSYHEVRDSSERMISSVSDGSVLFDSLGKLRQYFSSEAEPKNLSTLVLVNINKEAYAYSAEVIDSDDVRSSLSKFIELVKDKDPSEPEPPVVVPPPEEEMTEQQALLLGLENINKPFLQEKLRYITQDKFDGRLSGTSGNEQVADYIISHLKEWGIAPARGNGDYRQGFRISNGPTRGRTTSNIVALIPGTDELLKNEYIVIGAHMDHAGTLSLGYTCSRGSSGSNQICNGADDNGSGTISVLNIARSLSLAKSRVKRSIVLMWFSGEELGLEGSWHYVSSDPIFSLRKTAYMINLDMVGYMRSFGNKLGALGGGTSRVGSRIISSIGSKYPGRSIQVTSSAGGGSDHVPFMDAGIPGVFFHTGVSNNSNYHRTSDTPDLIDFDGMVVAAKVAFETLFRVANEPTLVSYKFHGSEDIFRKPLVTPEERLQTCHHLGMNPHVHAISAPTFN